MESYKQDCFKVYSIGHGYTGEFSSKASFHVSTQLIQYDPCWFERRKAILEKEVPEENTQVYHKLDSVIKKN